MKTTLTLVLIILLNAEWLRAQAPAIAEAPPVIQKLAAVIQGKRPAEVRAEIIRQFGPPQGDVGSGVRIELWNVAGGTLTFHPSAGPSFGDSKTNQVFRLIQTENRAGASILGSYEMTTLPDPKMHGNKFWLGNLKISAEGAYRFVDSGQHLERRAGQRDNFFMVNPAGTVKVRYVAPVTAETLLESLPEGAVVAKLEFDSADHRHQATFSIVSSERNRLLRFDADGGLAFEMDAGWKSSWQ